MSSVETDHTVLELSRTELTLRSDLVFTPRFSGGKERYYVIEDPVRGRFHRVGVVEYTFISLLDGSTSVVEALRLTSRAIPDHGLTETDAASICRWLVDEDLAHTNRSTRPDRLIEKSERSARQGAARRWNPIVFKLSLGNPDRPLTLLSRLLSWLHRVPAMIVALLLMSAALWQVIGRPHEVTASSEGILAPGNWPWLFACWLVLKIVHESSHGIVCKMHGGDVREVGVIFVLLAPLAYVDVTSSWRFTSNWKRIHTAVAGMYAELLVASVAALIWSRTEAGPVNVICFNLMVMASVTTLAFNANPLMKFDGYYVLADLLEIPNLYANGAGYVRYLLRRYFLGTRVCRPAWFGRRGAGIVRLFGVASLAWRISVAVCLVITASALFHGAGIVLSCVAALLWLAAPTVGLVRHLRRSASEDPRSLIRPALLTAISLAFIVALFTVVPWPGGTRAPVIVDFAHYAVARASSPGFVREVLVREGQSVVRGDPLIVLTNDVLESAVAELRLAIEKSEIESRVLRNGHRMAEYQAEMKKQESLREKLSQRTAQMEELTVRAPRDGMVIGRRLADLVGTYLEQGDEILGIGDENEKELTVSVSQDDVEVFTSSVGREFDVWLDDGERFRASLGRVDPRAGLSPLHPAMIAPEGGPLAVRRVTEREGRDSDLRPDFELLSPRFEAAMPLSAERSQLLRAGQLGSVSRRAFDEAFGRHVHDRFVRWVRRRVETLTSR